MPRIALGLEYDGTDFVGWQIQQTGRTVEGTLAAAVSFVAGAPVVVHGSGRTDAGVHALHQVAHFDTTVDRTPRQWLLGINSNLPPDVAIRWVREVPAGFDARGLPMGIQIVGPNHAEMACMQLVYAYDEATRWVSLRPPRLAG